MIIKVDIPGRTDSETLKNEIDLMLEDLIECSADIDLSKPMDISEFLEWLETATETLNQFRKLFALAKIEVVIG